MASNDEGDFWASGGKKKGKPQPPAGGEGFWGGTPPKPEPAASGANEPPGGFWTSAEERAQKAQAQSSVQGGGEFWNKAEEKRQSDQKLAALSDDQKLKLKKQRRRRRWLIGSGAVVLLLVVLVALTPTIAGWVAPGIIESRASREIVGSVKVEKTSFGWFGGQRIHNARLLDKDGKVVASFGVEVEKGLRGFIFGNLDVGTVTLRSVKADIVKYADGTTNLERAVAPAAPGKPKAGGAGAKEPPRIPDSLDVRVVARDMQVTFTDLSRPGASVGTPAVVISKADLEAQLAAGKPVVLTFSGSAAGAGTQPGRIKLDVKADKVVRADGVIEADKAVVDASVTLDRLPTALADAFVTLPGNPSVRQALGDTLDASVAAKGGLSSGSVQLAANAGEDLRVKGALSIDKGVLTTDSPMEVFVSGKAVRALAPQVDSALREQGTATIEVFPSVTVAVSNLRVAVPRGGAAPDLRGMSVVVGAALGGTSGTVQLGEGRAPEPFTVSPLRANIQATDLAQGVKVTAATTATLNGQPAGDVSVDLDVSGLLDPRGAPVKGPPGSIQGVVAVRRIATAVAQPFLAATPAGRIDLPRDIGPTLDVEVKAATQPGGVGAGQTPPTDITVAVASESLKVNGGVQLTHAVIRTTGDGLTVHMTNPVGVGSKFLGPDSGLTLLATTEATRRQGLVLTVKGVEVPRDAADGALRLDQAAAQVQVAVSGLVVAANPAPPGGGQAPALAVNNAVFGAELTPGGHAKATLNMAMAYAGTGFTASGAFDVPGAVVSTDGKAALAPVARLRPVGQVDIKNVPTRLAGMFIRPGAPAPGEKPLDLAQLIADTLGDKVTVSVATAAPEGAPGTLGASVAMKSPTTTAEVSADLSQSALAVRKVTAQANVTPQTVTGLTRAFAPGVAGAPRLVGPARVNVEVAPITIPLVDYAPQLARAGVASAKVTIPGRTMVEGLQATGEDGTKRDLGPVGVDSLSITARVPVAAVVGPALPNERRVTATLGGTVIAQSGTLTDLSANLSTEVSDGALAGALKADLRLSAVDTVLLEQLAGKPGLISGVIGNSLTVLLSANLTPPAGAAGQAFDARAATTHIELSLDAPRLRTDGPLAATLTPAGMVLDKPVKMVMDVEPAWLNRFFEKAPPPGTLAGKPPPPDLQLTQPTSLTLTIDRLAFPRPEGPGTLLATAAVSAAIPQLQLRTSDGQSIKMRELVVRVDAAPVRPEGTEQFQAAVPVNLRLDVGEATVGDQPAAKSMTLRGAVSDLLQTDGTVSVDRATVTLDGDLPAIPTALIDALAKQDGLLVDALGPVASVKVQVQRFPLGDATKGGEPPVLALQAESQRAKADLRGTVKDNVFHTERAMEVTISELTEDLAKRLIKGLPLMGTMSKSPKDAPALITGYGLTAPLSNDMSKLNGEFKIDPGEARFNTSTGFAKLLKMGGQQQSGLVGQKLRPIVVHVKQGVATYERWTLPLGEFNVETEGTVDLVRRTIDVVTYVPFSHLSESTAGALNTTLTQVLGAAGGRLVNAATMVPIRTSGPLDNPSTGIDSRAFAENLRKNLKPEDLIKEGLGDLLKDQLRPKNP